MELEKLQPKIFQEFKHILKSDRLSHAYLFSGDFASFEMALLLAKSRFCEQPTDGLPCGECRSCRLIAANDFSDVRVVEPSGQLIKTETIRSLLREFSSSGFEGQSQVFIIRDADKMHVNAANSLLKFIEEPQSDSYIILLTRDDSKILPTIKSRTQIFHFPKNTVYLTKQLEQAGLLKNQAEILADLAKDWKQAEEFSQNSKMLDLLKACERFVSLLFKSKDLAFLEGARLAQTAADKSEQDWVFQILTLLLAKQYEKRAALDYLEAVYQAKQMWLSNVNFQNALEYMVIK
ncbi:DNA polymerase III subunit delta' [Streptococcus caviae]|uniref:DNA polymerase III subunit delta' n=1 Tax=Streptococcus sp. 'caviae' TaxID=1915004 RepID=UPI00094BBB40|nr:DNA polymerase III subunit delta' [Streptococcus sp. 'caviae']OLN83665.1 DNA polymerase III subunit delta' [Streptococcus sp. 'caviae']